LALSTKSGARYQFPNCGQTVTSYDLAPAGQGATQLTVSVHGSGELDEKTPGLVEKVWKHFILERFKPYIESGAYKKRKG
jgi:hypothetical protein